MSTEEVSVQKNNKYKTLLNKNTNQFTYFSQSNAKFS